MLGLFEVRPIRPEDEPLLAAFHHTLSDETVYGRYFAFLNVEFRVKHEILTRQCWVDHEHEMAYVATIPGEADPITGKLSPGWIVGVGRLSDSDGSGIPEIAITVSDAFQHHGIGTTLVRHLVAFAREKAFPGLKASVLPDNQSIQMLLEREGFKFMFDTEEQVMAGLLHLK